MPIILLSSPGSHDEQRARFQKRLWVDQHFGKDVPLILRRRVHKQDYAALDSILIDDWHPTIVEWSQRGGHAIHHKSATESLEQLKTIVNCEYLNWLVK